MSDIFPVSFFLGLFFIYLNKLLSLQGIKNIRPTPQTLHHKSTSRFGGIAIYLSLFLVSFYSDNEDYAFLSTLLLCSVPMMVVGLLDDFNLEIQPRIRMLTSVPTALMCYFLLGTQAYSLEIPYLDFLFDSWVFSLVFISFALVGVANAFNIIDGINGQVLIYSATVCVCVLFFTDLQKTTDIYLTLVSVFFAILGILVLNFPFGKIFIGDGGAYILGIIVSVVLIKIYQINELSPWYVMLVLIYPVTEIISSIFRRIIEKFSTTSPDNNHLHHLIYKRISKIGIDSERVKHFLVSLLIFFIYLPFILGANYFRNETSILVILTLFFAAFYFIMYLLLSPKNFRIK